MAKNIIDLEKSERALLDVKEFAKENNVKIKTNQQLIDYAMTLAASFVRESRNPVNNI